MLEFLNLNLNERPAYSFDSALDFMGAQGTCSDGTLYVLW